MKVLIVVTLALSLATASNLNLTEIEKVPRGRIRNGQYADPKQFPYIVGLSIQRSTNRIWCSGSLIKKEWVLTAAHCLRDVVTVDVFLGASNGRKNNEKLTVRAKDTIIHENYNDDTDNYDIGLIKISSVDFTDYIQAIKLPEKGNSDYGGKKVLIAGWGVTTYKKGPVNILQWGRMEVISNDECAKINEKKYVSCFRINTKPIDDTSPCMGDSGGPLVLESNPNVLIGICDSMSEFGCNVGLPVIFTNVQAHLNWISKNINKKSNKKLYRKINKNNKKNTKKHKIVQH